MQIKYSLISVSVQIVVFCAMTPLSLVYEYDCFGNNVFATFSRANVSRVRMQLSYVGGAVRKVATQINGRGREDRNQSTYKTT